MSSASTGRRPLKQQPKQTVRKSQQERDALAKAEDKRQRERKAAADADAAAEAAALRAQYGSRAREGDDARRGGRGGPDASYRSSGRGGRGGFMGAQRPPPSQTVPRASGAVAGPPSSAKRRGRVNPSASSSHGTGSRVKQEPKIKADRDGDIAMLGLPGVKREPDDWGYVSSDPEERAKGPRKDIDFIGLSTDEETDGERVSGSDRRTKHAAGRKTLEFVPVRLQRREHVDRAAGISTEASLATAAEIRRQAEEHREEQNPTFDEALASVSKKGKTRSRDVEILGGARVWKGVYEEESEGQNQMRIKEEPAEELHGVPEVPEVPAVPAVSLEDEPGPAVEARATHDDDLSSEGETKEEVKAKIKKRAHDDLDHARRPTFQSPEEGREWDIQQHRLRIMQEELGRIDLDGPPEEVAAQNSRNDTVYLFQLPPVLPDLVAHSPGKQQNGDTELVPPVSDEVSGSAIKTEGSNGIKVEGTAAGAKLIGSQQNSARPLPTFAPGRAGKLCIYKSGRATMTWGGLAMEMSMGVNPYFLQSTVLTRLRPESTSDEASEGGAGSPTEGSSAAYDGEAVSFGQVRGKLVLTPDWGQLLR